MRQISESGVGERGEVRPLAGTAKRAKPRTNLAFVVAAKVENLGVWEPAQRGGLGLDSKRTGDADGPQPYGGKHVRFAAATKSLVAGF